MRLIEKECPNCGANLSFTKDDTSCKCEYCKKEYEIERDTEKKKLDDQFTLLDNKTPFKFFSYFSLGSFVAQFIFVIVIFIIIIIVGINIVKGLNDTNSIFNRSSYLIEEISDLSNTDFNTIDIDSKILLVKEESAIIGDYTNKGNFKREKLYIISNEKENYLIAIYKTTYENLYNGNDKHIVYIPVTYKNIKSKNESISFSLGNGKITDNKYYFNENVYIYGYDNMDNLYNEVIKKYKKDYKIVEE